MKTVEQAADVVEVGAFGTTIVSGGTAAPVAVPVAGGPSTVSTLSLLAQAGIQILRDGEVSTQTSQDIGVSMVFSGIGKVVGKQVDNVLEGYSQPHAPSDEATRTTADGFLKVVEETTKGQVIEDDQNK